MKFLVLASMAMLVANSAVAGIDGGGGIGVLCPSANIGEYTLDLLDIHEAKRKGFKIPFNPTNSYKAAELASELIAEHFSNSMQIQNHAEMLEKEILTPLLLGRSWTNPSTEQREYIEFVEELPLSQDYGNADIDPSCSLKQVAYYQDTNKTLYISTPEWNQLDWLSKAALATHELVYLYVRRDNDLIEEYNSPELTSEKTRQFVGRLFSGNLTPAFSGLDKTQQFLCYAGTVENHMSTFYIGKDYDEMGKVRINFSELIGLESNYRLTTILQIFDLKNVASDRQFDLVSAPVEILESPINFPARVGLKRGADKKLKLVVEFDSSLIEQEVDCELVH